MNPKNSKQVRQSKTIIMHFLPPLPTGVNFTFCQAPGQQIFKLSRPFGQLFLAIKFVPLRYTGSTARNQHG